MSQKYQGIVDTICSYFLAEGAARRYEGIYLQSEYYHADQIERNVRQGGRSIFNRRATIYFVNIPKVVVGRGENGPERRQGHEQ